MKNVSLSSIAKMLPLFFLSLQYFDATAQNESVIFNLTEGKFNIEKIPYVHAITITGIPTKDGENVDAIRLVVNKVTSDEEKDLLVKQARADQLKKETAAITAKLDFLNKDILAKIAVGNISKLKDDLTEHNFNDLAKEFEKSGTSPDEAELERLRDETKKEIAKQTESNKKIDAEDKEIQGDIVKLQKKVSALPFFEGMWIRKSADDVEFTLALPDKLEMAESYQFAFSIYKQNKITTPIDELIYPLVDELNSRLEATGSYDSETFTERVSETIDKIEDDFFTDVFTLDPTNVSLAPKKGFGLNATTVTRLTALIEDFYQADLDQEEDAKIAASARIGIADTIGTRSITAAQRNLILTLIELPGKEVELEQEVLQAGYSAEQASSIDSYYRALESAKDHSATNLGEAVKAKENIEKIFTEIKNLYMQVGNVTYKASTGDTDIDGIQVSTTYGFGFVSLGNNTIEWFRFFGINMRFDGYDNRLLGKEAYHSYWSRISLMVGISTTSDMQYKGDNLENTRLGLKPVIGINWEPFKHINVGAGMISFIQESTADSQKDPKIRPYVSLSFDFNLFNYLIQKQ